MDIELLDNIKLFNLDCFEFFKKVEDNSINLFILDLPYANKQFGNCTACKWDTPIDLTKMWVEIKRTMKPHSVIVFFCNAKFGYSLINSNPKWFSYDLIWKKSRKVGFLAANKQPLRQHELMYIFKESGGTYNPQKTEGKPYTCKQGQQTNLYGIEEKNKIITENKGDRHPTSIIEKEYEGETILKFNNPPKPIHRTQKPVDLIEWLIKSYSNEKDVICDFTFGSGSTPIACLNTNRQFVGCERDKDIFNSAEDRIIKLFEV
tara:strand:- start:1542 stop:2327 length:786 start_codon:yes stop_codon:yes gene_type:complete